MSLGGIQIRNEILNIVDYIFILKDALINKRQKSLDLYRIR
jgi:hypothetical protein